MAATVTSALRAAAGTVEESERESGLSEHRSRGEPERREGRGEGRFAELSDVVDAFGLGEGVRLGDGRGKRSSSFSSRIGGGTGAAEGAGRIMSSFRLITAGTEKVVVSRREMEGPSSEPPSAELLLPD